MEVLSLILAVIALVSAILVYYKAGGVADLSRQIEKITSSVILRNSVKSLRTAAEAVTEKTGETMMKLGTSSGRGRKKQYEPIKNKLSEGFEELRKRMFPTEKRLRNTLHNTFEWTQRRARSIAQARSGDSVGGDSEHDSQLLKG